MPLTWTIISTEQFDGWFDGLTDAEKVETLRKITLLRNNGPSLSRPHADTLSGSAFANMKELRASTSDSVIRIAFAFDPSRSAILLCGGLKHGVNQRRFYKKLIRQADQLFAEHLKALKQKG